MDYKIVKRVDCIDGTERLTVAITVPKSTLLTIPNTRNKTERELVIAIFNEAIRQEKAIAKKQEIARKRYAYELATA